MENSPTAVFVIVIHPFISLLMYKGLLCTDQRKRIFDHMKLDSSKIFASLLKFPKQIEAKNITKKPIGRKSFLLE